MGEREDLFGVEAFIFVIILVIYILTSHLIEMKKVPYLHESTMAILMGALTATLAKYGLGKEIKFSDDLFFAIILPPIIFAAGYSLRKSLFFDNFAIIGYLGIVGTIIGFVCMTIFLIIINTYIFQALKLNELMMISSVLCATDTVAAMALIRPEKYPVLNAVLFGEGIINDAVAIILFRTISQLKITETSEFKFREILQMSFDFTYLFFSSVAFGVITGFGLSYLFKHLPSFNNFPLKETSLILLNGYFTYLMGQLLGLSGIITLFTCAIIMGHYCFLHISEQSQMGTGLAFETVGYIAQAFVFAYLGASILSIDGEWSAVLMALMILAAMPVIRAIMVYILPLVYRILKKPFPLNPKQLKVCLYSGMVRGVIAFALCLSIKSVNKKYIVTVALVLVMATTIMGSTFLKSFMKWIGIKEDNLQQRQGILQEGREKQLDENNQKEIRGRARRKSSAGVMRQGIEQEMTNNQKFIKFQQQFLSPIFGKSQKSDEEPQAGGQGSKRTGAI